MHRPQPRVSPNATAWFLVGQFKDDSSQDSVTIETPFRIGRNPGADLCLSCKSVSGSHAELVEEKGELWIVDLDSTNGTFVNGVRIGSRSRLNENDKVQFGRAVVYVSRNPESQAAFCEGLESEMEGIEAKLQDQRFEQLCTDGVLPFFQPILQIEDDESHVKGYEVLGRSRLFEFQTPDQMFTAASRLEMEAELSRVLRNEGIRIADKHLSEECTLFVNSHPAELDCEGLEKSLLEIRANHPSRPIILKIHESVINDSAKFIKLNAILKQVDIQLALQDFGAGQIRLAELSRNCPDLVKFDVELTRGLNKSTLKKQRFVRALVKLVTDLGITPMAACVEQVDEHQTLRQLGFKLGQGFLYGRPSSIADCIDVNTLAGLIQGNDRDRQVNSVAGDPEENKWDQPEDFDRQPKDADWLLKQPGHYYTIQVLSAISLDRANEHVAMQEDPSEMAVFCKAGKSRSLYIVVKGIFEDRAAAKEASAKLGNAIVSPWIRMLSSVHAEIRSQ